VLVLVAVPMCTGCAEPIFDRFILKVQDRSWHSRCLKCSDCHAHLSDKCFSKGDDVYCKDDFFRFVGSRDTISARFKSSISAYHSRQIFLAV